MEIQSKNSFKRGDQLHQRFNFILNWTLSLLINNPPIQKIKRKKVNVIIKYGHKNMINPLNIDSWRKFVQI